MSDLTVFSSAIAVVADARRRLLEVDLDSTFKVLSAVVVVSSLQASSLGEREVRLVPCLGCCFEVSLSLLGADRLLLVAFAGADLDRDDDDEVVVVVGSERAAKVSNSEVWRV